MTTVAQIFLAQHPALPQHIFPISHWLPSHGNHISSPPIGHQGTWLIIISHLLIIIPGICIASHAFMTSRSLTTLPKLCLILLKNILY